MLQFNVKALVEERKKKNLTQKEVGKIMRVRAQRIQQIESGTEGITLNTLERIWAALEVTDPRPFFIYKSE